MRYSYFNELHKFNQRKRNEHLAEIAAKAFFIGLALYFGIAAYGRFFA